MENPAGYVDDLLYRASRSAIRPIRHEDSRKIGLDLRWGGIMPFLVVGKACP